MRRILNTFSNNLGKAKAAYSMLTDDTKTANYTTPVTGTSMRIVHTYTKLCTVYANSLEAED